VNVATVLVALSLLSVVTASTWLAEPFEDHSHCRVPEPMPRLCSAVAPPGTDSW